MSRNTIILLILLMFLVFGAGKDSGGILIELAKFIHSLGNTIQQVSVVR